MTLVQKEVTGVYLWTSEEVNDMQGPCDDGFHVPTKDEFSALYSTGVSLGIWGERSGAGLNTYLKMPFAGWRANSSSNVENQGTVGGYWVCTVRDGDYAYNMYLSATYNMDYNFTHYGQGSSIRAFKDKVEIPDSSWTALYSDKVYHNSDLGLISISADGTNWITIQDKNVGATTVYNSGDTLSEANCGKYFQRGNNYGFPFTGSVTTSSTKVNASDYGPGNYYSSSTFITGSGNWSSSRNDNLRGGVTQQTGTVFVEHKVRPAYKPRTFTITRTEKSDMSSGWTYSDDAAGLTAGDGAFDDFFGYSAVLLNTSGVETAEMTQSGGVFTGAMSTLGNITSGDNVMIKFPVRGIKMSKSGSTVTLSITEELNKDGYQYYAFQNTGDINSNTESTATKPLYLGAYKSYNNSNTMKSWSGRTPTGGLTMGNNLTYSGNNGVGYTIMGWYQKCLVNAYYMMKYGNPNGQNVIGLGYTETSENKTTTGGTNSQTNATYGNTSSYVQMKLFGLEDRWGNASHWIGGMFTDSSKNMYVALHDFTATISTSQSQYKNAGTISNGSYYNMSSILGTNKGMFGPIGTVNNSNYNTYYSDFVYVGASCFASDGSFWYNKASLGPFFLYLAMGATGTDNAVGSRLMYL